MQKKQKEDYDMKLKAIGEKINFLQTELENAKTDLAFVTKKKKLL